MSKRLSLQLLSAFACKLRTRQVRDCLQAEDNVQLSVASRFNTTLTVCYHTCAGGYDGYFRHGSGSAAAAASAAANSGTDSEQMQVNL